MVELILAALTLVPYPREVVECGGFTSKTNVSYETDATIPAEGYRLEVAADGVKVSSSDAAGAFYAKMTLNQLKCKEGLPLVKITDSPRYRWRGVHFDDCRHFFGKQTLKRTLDLMAQHKMNVLHWHLTEDQGWRLDIPGYPELIKYGAIRPSSPAHRARRWQENGVTKWEMDDMVYGPFYYTENEVKEILAYAAERYIKIVPEIELPGHVCAALAAYPEFACKPENLAHRHPRLVWGIEKDVLCLGNAKAIKFMEDVVDYVCRLFPSEYIHIGGDECPTERWKECPKCQAKIREEGLKDEKGLQPWITRHFVKFLEQRGKRAIGWDEYLNGDVPLSAVGMNWRTGKGHGAKGLNLILGAEAAAKGHDMVMAPAELTYFWYGQGLKDDPFQYGGPKHQLTLALVYGFDPCKGVKESARKHILGGQCCNWSEYTWNECDLEWKMWPRGCAMAETLWLGEAKPGYEHFISRMQVYRSQLIKQGVNCAPLE